jgi:hypothetical protein
MRMYSYAKFALVVTLSAAVLSSTAIAQSGTYRRTGDITVNSRLASASDRVDLLTNASYGGTGSADRLFEKAKAAAKAGDYEKACDLATRAHDITSANRTTAGTQQDMFYAEKMAEYCEAAKG